MAGRLVVRVVGPLAPYVSGFDRELGSRGYTRLSANGQRRLMAQGADSRDFVRAEAGCMIYGWRSVSRIEYRNPILSEMDRHFTRRAVPNSSFLVIVNKPLDETQALAACTFDVFAKQFSCIAYELDW